MRKDVVERLSTVHVIVVGPEQARAQAVVEVLLRQAAATETAGCRSREHYETERRHSARDGVIFGPRALVALAEKLKQCWKIQPGRHFAL